MIPALGLSAFSAYNFILGHVVFSFGAPVAVAEAWAPERAREPWLGRTGTLVSIVAYLGTAGLIVADPESQSGSAPQLLVSASVVGALVIGAVAAGRRAARHSSVAVTARTSARRLVPVWATLILALVAALIISMATETWFGFTEGTAMTCAVGLCLSPGLR